MKLFIIAIVTLAALSCPVLTYACPPPPAPGYDGGEEVGQGPTPDEASAPVNPGDSATGDDSTSSSDPGASEAGSDVSTSDTCM